MKKYMHLIAALLISAAAYSQTSYVSTYNQVAQRSEYTGRLVWGDVNKAVIKITFYSNEIRLDNKNQTVLEIIKDEGENTGTTKDGIRFLDHTWIALDSKNRRCQVIVTRNYNEEYDNLFTIVYENMVFRYYLPKGEIDKF